MASGRRRDDHEGENHSNEREEVEFRAMGAAVRARGYRLQDVLIILSSVIVPCVVGVAVIFIVNEWRLQNEAQRRIIIDKISAEHQAIDHNQKEVIESLEELVYINSLTPEEKVKLRVQMPHSLRKKLNDR